MKIFDPKLTGSIQIQSNIESSVTIEQDLTVQGTINGKFGANAASAISGAFTLDSSSLASRIDSLEAFDANLDTTYATDYELGLVDTRVATLEGKTLLSSSAQIASDISGSFTELSSSIASTYLLNTTDTLDGDLTVTGKITAQEFHTEFVSASIIYESGSTQFGNSADDTHIFSGSISVSNGILGTLSTAAQPNITSLGTLSSLSAAANSNVATFNRTASSGATVSIQVAGSTIGTLGASTDGNGKFDISSVAGGASSDILQISRNGGTPTATFNSSGSVGIGTTSPSNLLHLLGNSAAVRVEESGGAQLRMAAGGSLGYIGTYSNHNLQVLTNGSPSLTVDTAGYVGITTTAPLANLHINEDSGNTYGILRLEGSNRGGIIDMYQGAYPVSQYLTDQSGNTYISTSGGFGNTSLSTKFTILTGGNVGIGTTSPSAKLEVKGNFKIERSSIAEASEITMEGGNFDIKASPYNYPITFHTGTGGTSTERMRIDYDGNFGFGTLGGNPAAPLHFYKDSVDVNGNNDVTLLLQNTLYDSADSGDTYENKIAIGWANHYAAGISAYKNAVNTTGLKFYTEYGYNVPEERMRINALGSVGIGSNSPGVKLDVNGDGRFVSNAASRVLYLKQNQTNAGNIIQFQNQSGSDVWEVVGRNNQFYIFNTAAATYSMFISPTSNRIGINRTDPDGRLDVKGGIRQSNSAATYSRVQTVHGQTGTYSTVTVIFDKTAWGSVTYDIKVASAGGTYHTAGAYYSNPGFSNDLVSISTGSGISVSKTAASPNGGTQGATWTFSGATMIHPVVTVDIACGNGFQVTEDSIIVQFT